MTRNQFKLYLRYTEAVNIERLGTQSMRSMGRRQAQPIAKQQTLAISIKYQRYETSRIVAYFGEARR